MSNIMTEVQRQNTTFINKDYTMQWGQHSDLAEDLLIGRKLFTGRYLGSWQLML